MLILVCLPVWRAQAHRDPQAPVPAVQACAVEEELTVDGLLEEAFWSRVEVATEFIDERTQRPADDQTRVRVAYTLRYVYIAVECLDDQAAEVRATEQREDRFFSGDDWVEVHIDPVHSHRGKYAFFANPLGTRADASEGPSGMFNFGWTAEWDCAAVVGADRWTLEMRIPFSILNYERRDRQTWGLNVTRQQRRTDVLSFWSFNASDMYKPRHFGHLTGLDLAQTEFDPNWEVTPYGSARVDFNGDTSTTVQGGVDVSFRLTPSITTALTLNPDFGQVEADADTIELRDTERFLPERRPFFREGDELIRMPHRLYYSRRFTEIDGGLNTSGRWGGLGFSFLNIQGDVSRDNTYYGNSSVLRVLQPVGERSTVGYYGSGSFLEGGDHAASGSLDSTLFLTDDWRMNLQTSITDELLDDETGSRIKDGQGYLGYTSLIYDRYPWRFDAGYTAITEGFDPLLGFIPRRDIFGPTLASLLDLKSDGTYYKELLLLYEFEYFDDAQGATSLRDHTLYGRVLVPNDVGLRLGHSIDYHAPYDNRRTQAGMSIFTTDLWRSFEYGWAGGVFEESDYNEFYLEKPVKFWERLPIQWEFVVRLEEDRLTGVEDTIWLNRIVFDLFLAKNMWMKGSLQHQDNNAQNISLIYGWEFYRRTWWYLVFNNLRNLGGDEDDGSSIFTKITYTF
jgi:hypothetical protein